MSAPWLRGTMDSQHWLYRTHRSTVRRHHLTIVLLLLSLLLAFGLRVHLLDVQSFWNDEGTSVAMAQRDLATVARDAAQDIHPPLYYWLLSGWVRLFGTGEAAVRSLSVLLGVILVALIYPLGSLLAGPWAGLAATFLAAINPFQVYYSQEARMYMLLALLVTLTFYATLKWVTAVPGRDTLLWGIVYVLAATAGLYTHYAFPMALLAVNLALLLFVTVRREPRPGQQQTRSGWWWLWRWVVLQVVVVALFVPWLPTAYRQLATWPRVEQAYDLVEAVIQIGQQLVVGPAAPPFWEWLVVLVLLLITLVPSRGDKRLPAAVAVLTPVLWLVLPVALILGLGLFKEAYLKFLLITSPAYCLLAGRFATIPLRGKRRFEAFTAVFCVPVILFVIYASGYGLNSYYNDAAYARDDYRGIAAYIDAVGRPGDAILLNAPGQQEVFDYYYDGDLPVHPLPEGRPLDRAATEAALINLARPGSRVFAVLWATNESDPERFIEGWLDSHTYKALDAWHGNVRLAIYAVPEQIPGAPEHALDVRLQDAETGDQVTLLGYSLLNDRLAAGDIAQITLFWQADRTPSQRYKVFLHVLDEANHIVGQRDAEPGGGVRLTTLWKPGEVITDHYGLPIHPATPPGQYRVEVGVYDAGTGRRLTTPEGAGQIWLEPLAVDRPPAAVPPAALGVQHPADAQFGELRLVGYDLYKLGFAHQPGAPLRPGDVLHANLYWRAEAQPRGDWALAIGLVDANAQEWTDATAQPVGGYPTSRWQTGDVWRGQFDLVVPEDVPPGQYRLRLQLIAPDGSPSEPFLSGPFVIEP